LIDIQDKKDIRSEIETKFNIVEKELQLLTAETNIHTNKFDNYIIKHNKLDTHLQDHLEKFHSNKKIQDL